LSTEETLPEIVRRLEREVKQLRKDLDEVKKVADRANHNSAMNQLIGGPRR
jgi:Sec-independent protein translocase protein TatA